MATPLRILERRSADDGRLIGLDRDADALAGAEHEAARAPASLDERVQLVHSSFRRLDRAVLAELGHRRGSTRCCSTSASPRTSSTPPARGFRFSDAEAEAGETPLDMRMDPSGGETAAELLRRASADELEGWFRDYGELPGARRLARAIVERASERAPVATSADLLRVIREARVGRGRKHNPATLVFQALRIAVNDELSALREGLSAADLGAASGRAAGRDRVPLPRGPHRQARLPRRRPRLHLPSPGRPCACAAAG